MPTFHFVSTQDQRTVVAPDGRIVGRGATKGDAHRIVAALNAVNARRPTTARERRRQMESDMTSAHAEGLHDGLPREGCPECADAATLESVCDGRVQRRLATDRAYRNAENAEEQAEREQEITEQEWAKLTGGAGR